MSSGNGPINEFRKGDTQGYTCFRPSRFFKDGGRWYFHTREGTIEGPFEHKGQAKEQLQAYVKIANSGFYFGAVELALEPMGSP